MWALQARGWRGLIRVLAKSPRPRSLWLRWGSDYTYVEAVPDQTLRNWIEAHVRCLRFLGGVPKIVVCDNLKAAVTREPEGPVVQYDLRRFCTVSRSNPRGGTRAKTAR